jgi:hypothetical protein
MENQMQNNQNISNENEIKYKQGYIDLVNLNIIDNNGLYSGIKKCDLTFVFKLEVIRLSSDYYLLYSDYKFDFLIQVDYIDYSHNITRLVQEITYGIYRNSKQAIKLSVKYNKNEQENFNITDS